MELQAVPQWAPSHPVVRSTHIVDVRILLASSTDPSHSDDPSSAALVQRFAGRLDASSVEDCLDAARALTRTRHLHGVGEVSLPPTLSSQARSGGSGYRRW
jgi:hypothetical protein